MARYEDLPYRTCVGMMLINAAGLVFIGRRAGGAEHVDESHVWQMPQGGVDPGEGTWDAAKRELYEETNVRSVEKIAEIADWLIYDIPRTIAGRAWKGRYRGQRQKWYAVRFTGEEAKIPRHVYIFANGWSPSPFGKFAEAVQDDPAWEYHEAEASHNVMGDQPDQLLQIVLGCA